MYGTIARMQLKPGAEEKMRALMKDFEDLKVPGFQSTTIFQSDRNPTEYYMAVVFDSRDAYMANADSPEQNRRYQQYRELLTTDPEWHDGEVVYRNG